MTNRQIAEARDLYNGTEEEMEALEYTYTRYAVLCDECGKALPAEAANSEWDLLYGPGWEVTGARCSGCSK